MSSRVKSKPPWQSVGTGAKDVKALNARPAWQGVGSTRKASSRSASPAKAAENNKRPSRSPPRMTSEYTRSNTLHAYASDTVSSSTATTNNSVLTGSSVQSLDEPPAEKVKNEPVRAPRARSTAAPKTPAQRTPAPRKPASRTTASRTTATRAPAPRTPQPVKPSVRGTSRSSDATRTPKRRGSSRQAPRQSSLRTKDKDGWEADSEDSFTVVGVEPTPCVWSGDKDSEVRPSAAPLSRRELATLASALTHQHAYLRDTHPHSPHRPSSLTASPSVETSPSRFHLLSLCSACHMPPPARCDPHHQSAAAVSPAPQTPLGMGVLTPPFPAALPNTKRNPHCLRIQSHEPSHKRAPRPRMDADRCRCERSSPPTAADRARRRLRRPLRRLLRGPLLP